MPSSAVTRTVLYVGSGLGILIGLNGADGGRAPSPNLARAAEESPAPKVPTGPDSPAQITEKQWLEAQLVIDSINGGPRPVIPSSLEWVMFDNAVLAKYTRSTTSSDPEGVKSDAAVTACSLLNRTRRADWVKELRIIVTEFVSHDERRPWAYETRITATRIAVPRYTMDCQTKGLSWSRTVDGLMKLPMFEEMPLSAMKEL